MLLVVQRDFLFTLGPGRSIPCLVTESLVARKGYRGSCGVEEGHPRQKLAVEFFQDFLGGFDTVVLGFLENGNAAEVGIGEEDSVVRTCQTAAFFGEDRADGRADHGVAHAHDVDARNTLTDVGVDALEVVKNGFFPVGPVFFKKQLAILRRGAFGESPVKRPDGAVHVGAHALVHGINVAQRGRIEEDGVPGRLSAAGFGIAIEREVGGEPWGIDKVVKAGKSPPEDREREKWARRR